MARSISQSSENDMKSSSFCVF